MALPSLEDCAPGMRATGFCVLVALPDKETKIGSILIPEAKADRDHMNQVKGRVVSISPAAFDFASFGGEQPKVGDGVIFSRIAGIVTEGDDGREYRLLVDKEILAIFEEAA